MNELIEITMNENHEPIVSGRVLHEFLEVKTAYKDWLPRMIEYGFAENQDFCSILSKSTGGRPSIDHAIKLDMAKELCMIQRTEKGKQARQYFIQLEKNWNSPELVMSRALKMAETQIKQLYADNSKLSSDNQIMQPKAEQFEQFLDTDNTQGFLVVAKALGTGRKKLMEFLKYKNILLSDNTPSSYYVKNGYFTIVYAKRYVDKAKVSIPVTRITPKGHEFLYKFLHNHYDEYVEYDNNFKKDKKVGKTNSKIKSRKYKSYVESFQTEEGISNLEILSMLGNQNLYPIDKFNNFSKLEKMLMEV